MYFLGDIVMIPKGCRCHLPVDPEVRQIDFLCFSRRVSSVLLSGKQSGNNHSVSRVRPWQGLYMTQTKSFSGLCQKHSRGSEEIFIETKSPQIMVYSLKTEIRQLKPPKISSLTFSVFIFVSAWTYKAGLPQQSLCFDYAQLASKNQVPPCIALSPAPQVITGLTLPFWW